MNIKTWICSILVFSVFLTVLLQLLAGKQYEKYVRFFAGLIWILVVLQPMLQLFHLQNPLSGMVEMLAAYREDTVTESSLDVTAMKQYQKQAWEKQVSEAVRDVAEEKAAENGCQVSACEPVWKEDGSGLDALYVEVMKAQTGTETGSEISEKEKTEDIHMQTAVERIRIQIRGQKQQTEGKDAGKDVPETEALKKSLEQTFQLSEERVTVVAAEN